MLSDPLVATRAIHYAATIVVAGALVFSNLIVERVWQRAGNLDPEWIVRLRKQIAAIALFGLLTAVVSGAVQFFLLAAAISNESWAEMLGDGIAWTVLTETQFGRILQMRAVLALCLTGLLLSTIRRRDWSPGRLGTLSALLAVFFLAALAWTGHAGGALGIGGRMHLFNDVVHLLAAGTWLGGLIPLALLLGDLRRTAEGRCIAICGQVLSRFSNLGVVTVLALFTSGFINAWYLTDGMRGLVGGQIRGLAHSAVLGRQIGCGLHKEWPSSRVRWIVDALACLPGMRHQASSPNQSNTRFQSRFSGLTSLL
jgi:putative copper resistance protein D